MRTVVEFFQAMILCVVFLMLITAISFPTEFGSWLLKIDNGRYGEIDYDFGQEP